MQFNEDGSKIIFLTTEWVGYDNGSDLVMADSDGSNWTRLTHSENGEYFYFGTFNKFDDKIYYAYREYNGKFGIYKMDMDGSNSVQISNCSGVGIDENQEAGIGFIYPNPVSAQLKVNYEDDFMIEIFNLTGQIVLTSEESVIDVSMLKSGLYFIVLKDYLGNPVFHQKIVKE
ncbi:MAG: T9SS type A sorting domain-containing protein [Bacteroidales bacterium]|nr:T9SS type A sorting domain-containing protein [Bacteroidales bacterium]MCF8351520.1 T9SS type A sorting domain-containing protein [Bacteroidales bacterium]MCF8376511.1 T9SS type A sorting domain-containing protein [Bacteroidales bacterium]